MPHGSVKSGVMMKVSRCQTWLCGTVSVGAACNVRSIHSRLHHSGSVDAFVLHECVLPSSQKGWDGRPSRSWTAEVPWQEVAA